MAVLSVIPAQGGEYVKVITRLALSRITSKKARSAVICTAILLTMVLFMTIVSISVNMVSGYSLMMQMASGTEYHGYLRGATFTLTGEELRDAARQSNDIAEAAVSSNAAQYATTEEAIHTSSDFIRAIECEEDLQHFYTDLVEGEFPDDDTEILVNPLYFPDAKVGDTIGLYYISYSDEQAGTAYAEFTVSGMIKGRADAQMHVVMRYSDTLEEKYGFSSQYMNVYFLFQSSMNLTDKFDALVNETLAEYKLPEYEVHGVLNQAYLQSSIREALNPATIFLILSSATVVFLCSFLLIYNVYSIALTQYMQAFGLLNVIGMTYKQIRRMIVMQSMILFAWTLPVGLTAGYFIGWKLLSPLLFSSLAYEGLHFAFSPWIPLAAILLTVFTLLWSATRPLDKLKSLTPIATVEYSPAVDLPKRYVRNKNYIRKNVTPNAWRMAGYTISRNRKKTVITALSMSLSVILFMLIATLCDYMVAYTESNLQYADYIVKLNHTYRLTGGTLERTMPYDADGGIGMGEEYCKAVENSIYTDQVWRIRTAMTQISTPQTARESLGFLRNEYKFFDSYPELRKALSGQLDILVVGIPDKLFGKIRVSENNTIGSGYELGYAVYDGGNTAGIPDSEGKPYDLLYFQDGESVKLGNGKYQLIRSDVISPTDSITGWIDSAVYRAVLYLPESAFLAEFGEGLTYAMLVNAKEDCYELLRSDLEKCGVDFTVSVDEANEARYLTEVEEAGASVMETLSFSAGIDGRMDHFEQMKETVMAIQTVGYSLASIIFLIGALNIINTALSSASERKREFAMLEAVGMTDRQMMRMLLIESLYSGGVAVLITIFVGFPLIAVIINTAMDALVSMNWLSGALMLAVCILVSILSGTTTFRLTKSAAVVERIQVE